MGDDANQLGKNLGSNRSKADRALKKAKPIIPQIERVRDTMDFEIPFEMEFEVKRKGHRILMDLNFMPPPRAGCCADCSCSVCEFFDGGITETEYQVTYAYVPGTVFVFKDNIVSTAFTETNPATGLVTLWAHNNEDVVICYVFNICL